MTYFPPDSPRDLPPKSLYQSTDSEPMKILAECLDLMRKKAHDYQNPNSTVKQAMYYENGLTTLYDIINAKRLRLKSLLEAAQSGAAPKNESIEDTFKDMANYCAIAAAWCRGKIDGQNPNNDLFNKPIIATDGHKSVFQQLADDYTIHNPVPADSVGPGNWSMRED